jgi:polyhydroxyalkanoate synthase
MTLWLSSRAGLTSLKVGSPPWNGADDRLRALARELAQLELDKVSAALDGVVVQRAGAFLRGIEAYRQHPYHRPASRVPVLWREATTRLLDYGGPKNGAPVFIVPSLINRYYVLDLLPEHSFLRFLAQRGLRPLVIDWGEPGPAEHGSTLTDYISGRLDRALTAARRAVGSPLAITGYCMGGLLALALAQLHLSDTACLALLATPWDFHAERPEQAQLLASVIETLPNWLRPLDTLPVDVIQTLFWSLDPLLAERKFVRLAGLDPDGATARNFVALEDWINDGVPLAWNVARECARSWYGDNDPALGRWRVAGRAVNPQKLGKPALVVLPSRDRIVPPRSAEALASALPAPTILRPAFGHIGMMAAANAPGAVWAPIADWLVAHSRAA